jgi:hypothetical protein
MYLIDGIAFDEYYVESVELNLITCVLILKVIFHKDIKRIKTEKKYTFPTDCNVDINEYIKNLEKIINGSNI